MGRKLTGTKPKPGTLRTRRWRASVKRQKRGTLEDGNAWGTPDNILELVRTVMGGGIDCDPATSPEAQQRIQATVYYTEADNGLTKPWFGRTFINPPYGPGLVEPIVEKLITELAAGRVTEVIVLVNAATGSAWYRRLLSITDAHCLPSKRIRSVGADGLPSKGSPTHDQVFFYRGPAPERFKEVFEPIGPVIQTRLLAVAAK